MTTRVSEPDRLEPVPHLLAQIQGNRSVRPPCRTLNANGLRRPTGASAATKEGKPQ